MTTYSRRIVLESDYETALGDLSRALKDEGLQVIARIDVRDHCWRNGHDFRRYLLLEAWSPDLAFEALRQTLDAGPLLTTTLAVYELADGETAVTIRESLAPFADDEALRQAEPWLAAVADQERERVTRALARVTRAKTAAAGVV